jgi:hypothetical protein
MMDKIAERIAKMEKMIENDNKTKHSKNDRKQKQILTKKAIH